MGLCASAILRAPAAVLRDWFSQSELRRVPSFGESALWALRDSHGHAGYRHHAHPSTSTVRTRSLQASCWALHGPCRVQHGQGACFWLYCGPCFLVRAPRDTSLSSGQSKANLLLWATWLCAVLQHVHVTTAHQALATTSWLYPRSLPVLFIICVLLSHTSGGPMPNWAVPGMLSATNRSVSLASSVSSTVPHAPYLLAMQALIGGQCTTALCLPLCMQAPPPHPTPR